MLKRLYPIIFFFLCAPAHADDLSALTLLDGQRSGESFTAQLLAYENDGLKLNALIATPRQKAPEGGFPVIVANHGYVPDPKRYGFSADGENVRPGDYYRSVPALFTQRGYLVIMPDYRGHNTSEGSVPERYPADAAVEAYASDVLAIIPLISGIAKADADKLFLWGHSMGGPVSVEVLKRSTAFSGASLWSTGKAIGPSDDAGNVTTPVILHHGLRDPYVSAQNSVALVAALSAKAQWPSYFAYETDAHFFKGENLKKAADRDTAFFRRVTP